MVSTGDDRDRLVEPAVTWLPFATIIFLGVRHELELIELPPFA